MGTMNTTGLDFHPTPNLIQPPGVFNNPQTVQGFRPSIPYAEPQHFTEYPAGSFALAEWDSVEGMQYIVSRQRFSGSNTQIVSVPEQPVDKGTYEALQAQGPSVGSMRGSGVALQNVATNPGTVFFGQAPYSGVYTGVGGDGCD